MLRISLPGLTVLGAPYDRDLPTGFYVEKNGLNGWEGQPSGRRESVAPPFAHGEFDLPMFRTPRVVTISGYAVAESPYELRQMSNAVTGVGADGEMIPVIVELQGQVLEAYGRVLEAPFTDAGVRGRYPYGKFSVQLVCVDPRKFGPKQVVSGVSTVEVVQWGNFPALPRVRVSGTSPSGYTVTGPGGEQIVVSRPLTSGSPHTLELASGGLFVGGARVLGGVASYQGFTIPPRDAVVVSVSGGLSLQVTTPDTYM